MKYVLSLLLIFIVFSNTSANESQGLQKIYNFPNDETGFCSIDNSDKSLLITFFKEESKGIYRYKKGQISNLIENATNGVFSPDGKYYAYITDNALFICDETDKLVNKISIKDVYYIVWAYNSSEIYYQQSGIENVIYCFNVKLGTKKEVARLKRVYFHPLTVINKNILYFLQNTVPGSPDAICKIVKYDLSKKKFEVVKLPQIRNLNIFQAYSVSPDGRILIFENTDDGYIYIIDSKNFKILDRIKLFGDASPDGFSWELDGSHVIFTMTWKEIYRYKIPELK